jgi:hypothetical protein
VDYPLRCVEVFKKDRCILTRLHFFGPSEVSLKLRREMRVSGTTSSSLGRARLGAYIICNLPSLVKSSAPESKRLSAAPAERRDWPA